MEYGLVAAVLSAIILGVNYIETKRSQDIEGKLHAFMKASEPESTASKDDKRANDSSDQQASLREILNESIEEESEINYIGSNTVANILEKNGQEYFDELKLFIGEDVDMPCAELLEEQSKAIKAFDPKSINPHNGEEIYKALYFSKILLLLQDSESSVNKMSANQMELFMSNVNSLEERLSDHQNYLERQLESEQDFEVSAQLILEYINIIDSVALDPKTASPLKRLLNHGGLLDLEQEIHDKKVFACDKSITQAYMQLHFNPSLQLPVNRDGRLSTADSAPLANGKGSTARGSAKKHGDGNELVRRYGPYIP